VDFRRCLTVPTTMSSDVRGRGFSRRGVLKSGLGATATLLVRPVRAGAQDATPAAGLTEEQRGWWERGSRNDVNGWIHLRIAGAPFERGFQHGSCRTPRRPRSPRDRPTRWSGVHRSNAPNGSRRSVMSSPGPRGRFAQQGSWTSASKRSATN
jgi:hypothetical protein